MAIPILLVITGYVYALSLEKQKIVYLGDAYSWRAVLKRIIRYSIPLVFVILWELCDVHFSIPVGLLEKFRWAIIGTEGKGNYYYPVMMQLIFVFPLIYFITEKEKEKGFLICFIANALYEVLVWAYQIPTPSYRLLVFRYVFVIAAGIFTLKEYKLPKWLAVLMTIVGAVFIALVVYYEYEPKIVNKDWATTNFISSMLIIPLMIFVLQNVKLRFVPLEIIGQASYHIFLVQMMYYRGYYSVLQEKTSTWQEHLVLGVAICLAIGIVFYYTERPIQKWLQEFIRKTEQV